MRPSRVTQVISVKTNPRRRARGFPDARDENRRASRRASCTCPSAKPRSGFAAPVLGVETARTSAERRGRQTIARCDPRRSYRASADFHDRFADCASAGYTRTVRAEASRNALCFSNHSVELRAAFCSFSTSSFRLASYCSSAFSRPADSAPARASAKPMASSIASLVPEPTESARYGRHRPAARRCRCSSARCSPA